MPEAEQILRWSFVSLVVGFVVGLALSAALTLATPGTERIADPIRGDVTIAEVPAR
jgi:hypothetical protein